MANGIEGKCAIVTGAGSGNGRAIAKALAAAGASVMCADLNSGAAEETAGSIVASGGQAAFVQMDVSNSEDCHRTAETAVERLGGIDILVNNAGILVQAGLLDLSEAQWERVFAVNVKGSFLMAHAAAPQLKNRSGSIVMISSIGGLRGSAGYLAYSSSKHALIGMTRCIALELAQFGVRVNAVCPGLIRTPMIEDMSGSTLSGRLAGYPLGRLGEPEDVSGVVVHLVSTEAAWVTGLCYSVDGGAALASRI